MSLFWLILNPLEHYRFESSVLMWLSSCPEGEEEAGRKGKYSNGENWWNRGKDGAERHQDPAGGGKRSRTEQRIENEIWYRRGTLIWLVPEAVLTSGFSSCQKSDLVKNRKPLLLGKIPVVHVMGWKSWWTWSCVPDHGNLVFGFLKKSCLSFPPFPPWSPAQANKMGLAQKCNSDRLEKGSFQPEGTGKYHQTHVGLHKVRRCVRPSWSLPHVEGLSTPASLSPATGLVPSGRGGSGEVQLVHDNLPLLPASLLECELPFSTIQKY